MTKQRKTLRNDNIMEQKEKKQKVHLQSLCFNYVLDQKRIKKNTYIYIHITIYFGNCVFSEKPV